MTHLIRTQHKDAHRFAGGKFIPNSLEQVVVPLNDGLVLVKHGVFAEVEGTYLGAVAGMTTDGMGLWGGLCAWSLAHGHARSGDGIAIGSYLGKSDAFNRAIGDFSVAYADQSERDFEALKEAIADGRLPAELGI